MLLGEAKNHLFSLKWWFIKLLVWTRFEHVAHFFEGGSNHSFGRDEINNSFDKPEIEKQ